MPLRRNQINYHYMKNKKYWNVRRIMNNVYVKGNTMKTSEKKINKNIFKTSVDL